MFWLEDGRSALLAQKMALGRRGAIGRLPFFGALKVRRDLLFERVVAKLGREGDGTPPPFTPNLERQTFAPREGTLILIAMRFNVESAGTGEIAVVEAHGCTMRVEVDDNAP